MSDNFELSPVEQAAVEQSRFDACYPPTEKMPVIVVDNFPALGRLAAMRFIEWVQKNPEGVISLPTGKTPEYFIATVRHLIDTWEQPDTQEQLAEAGIDPAEPPDMSGLHFVQIDEFYPIDPKQENSFFHYVNELYIKDFGLDPARGLLINCAEIGLDDNERLDEVWPDGRVDLTLRYRQAEAPLERRQKEVLARIDQWCQGYEDRLRALGGIGFFLGGIGPDGHIGFNVRGSDHHSTTRLAPTNYETQAAAATALGGMHIARHRLVITIGLGTITWNPHCTAIIIAAGAAKADVVADAVQNEPDVLYPATALHRLPGARFYITAGAAESLRERRVCALVQTRPVSDEELDRALIDLAVTRNKRLIDLTGGDVERSPEAKAAVTGRSEPLDKLTRGTHDRLVEKVERGSKPRSGTTFLHTEPHHDDVMLGELPYVVRHTRDPENAIHFVTLTSGFTSVANPFMADRLTKVRDFLATDAYAELLDEGYFEPGNAMGEQRDVWQYLDGVAADSEAMRDEGVARRFVRDLVTVGGDASRRGIERQLDRLDAYFETAYPGKKDPPEVQHLKGMAREWEAECLWGYFGWHCTNVDHLRLGFYTGDLFAPTPTEERDVEPVLRYLRKISPDVLTLALDPEASGPDTHYKVLQVLTRALAMYRNETGREDIDIIGYRNVWYRFHPAEANVFVPVSLNMFSIMESSFHHAFVSQREALFPSHEHDGPFSELAQHIQVEQYQAVKTCLGREWFYEHPSALIRASRGLVFLKQMTLPELFLHSRKLRRATEA